MPKTVKEKLAAKFQKELLDALQEKLVQEAITAVKNTVTFKNLGFEVVFNIVPVSEALELHPFHDPKDEGFMPSIVELITKIKLYKNTAFAIIIRIKDKSTPLMCIVSSDKKVSITQDFNNAPVGALASADVDLDLSMFADAVRSDQISNFKTLLGQVLSMGGFAYGKNQGALTLSIGDQTCTFVFCGDSLSLFDPATMQKYYRDLWLKLCDKLPEFTLKPGKVISHLYKSNEREEREFAPAALIGTERMIADMNKYALPQGLKYKDNFLAIIERIQVMAKVERNMQVDITVRIMSLSEERAVSYRFRYPRKHLELDLPPFAARYKKENGDFKAHVDELERLARQIFREQGEIYVSIGEGDSSTVLEKREFQPLLSIPLVKSREEDIKALQSAISTEMQEILTSLGTLLPPAGGAGIPEEATPLVTASLVAAIHSRIEAIRKRILALESQLSELEAERVSQAERIRTSVPKADVDALRAKFERQALAAQMREEGIYRSYESEITLLQTQLKKAEDAEAARGREVKELQVQLQEVMRSLRVMQADVNDLEDQNSVLNDRAARVEALADDLASELRNRDQTDALLIERITAAEAAKDDAEKALQLLQKRSDEQKGLETALRARLDETAQELSRVKESAAATAAEFTEREASFAQERVAFQRDKAEHQAVFASMMQTNGVLEKAVAMLSEEREQIRAERGKLQWELAQSRRGQAVAANEARMVVAAQRKITRRIDTLTNENMHLKSGIQELSETIIYLKKALQIATRYQQRREDPIVTRECIGMACNYNRARVPMYPLVLAPNCVLVRVNREWKQQSIDGGPILPLTDLAPDYMVAFDPDLKVYGQCKISAFFNEDLFEAPYSEPGVQAAAPIGTNAMEASAPPAQAGAVSSSAIMVASEPAVEVRESNTIANPATNEAASALPPVLANIFALGTIENATVTAETTELEALEAGFLDAAAEGSYESTPESSYRCKSARDFYTGAGAQSLFFTRRHSTGCLVSGDVYNLTGDVYNLTEYRYL